MVQIRKNGETMVQIRKNGQTMVQIRKNGHTMVQIRKNGETMIWKKGTMARTIPTLKKNIKRLTLRIRLKIKLFSESRCKLGQHKKETPTESVIFGYTII